jgi:5-methyltetrahydrofolate--homocysteine methyltransferase
MTDLGGILDILVSFLGPQTTIIQMKRNPELIDTCRAIIMDKYLKIYDELQDIINKYVDGCNTWLNVWCPKRYYTMQCDFSVMLNPKFFERFALPDIVQQAEHMDYSIWHLDGAEQIKFLDDILPLVSGVQWVPGLKPGMPQDGADEWMPLYKKIQKAGKNIQMTILDHPLIPHVYKKLDPKGLFVYTFYMSKTQANCYLPEFIGGDGGKIISNILNWLKQNGKSKITKLDLSEYLLKNNIVINKEFENQIFKEVRKNLKGEKISYISKASLDLL